jgi:hypothetical protein
VTMGQVSLLLASAYPSLLPPSRFLKLHLLLGAAPRRVRSSRQAHSCSSRERHAH